MNSVSIRFLAMATCLATAAAAAPVLQHIGQYHSGKFDKSAAEISAYHAGSRKLFVVNALDASLDILDLNDPTNPIKIKSIAGNAHGGGINSVAVHGDTIAAAVENANKQLPGKVAFFDLDGNFIDTVTVGSLPDMLTFTPDGKTVLVANEGEPNGDYTVDPEGSVSLIDVSAGFGNAVVTHVDFTALNGKEDSLRSIGIRIFGPGATAAKDFEPEYIAVSADGKKAWVNLQENNALAIIDLENKTLGKVVPLGYKDWSAGDNKLDASDKDDAINIRNWPVFGMYMPDAIAAYEVGGQTYLVTANEGDSRDYDGYTEEYRINDIGDDLADKSLDPVRFPNAAELQEDSALGRLRFSAAMGDGDQDGDFDSLYVFGARSFSIWNAEGALVWDSKGIIEQKLAELLPEHFNSNNSASGKESRSDDKGPEPEGIAVGTIGDKSYAFVGLERIGGIMVFDITDPQAPTYVTYANNRDFSIEFDDEENIPDSATLRKIGDLGAEGIEFVPADKSPTGIPMLIVANEVSGSVSIWHFAESVTVDPPAKAHVATQLLSTLNGVSIWNGGFGSGMAKHPYLDGYFYLLTDRGPNVDGEPENGKPVKIFPVPDFSPQIGLFRLEGDSLHQVSIIPIRDSAGNAVTGLPNPAGMGSTGEVAKDLQGNILAEDPEGIDSEGLVATDEGTFWVSDEYGPHIVHLDGTGKTLERINPYGTGKGGRKLPAVLKRRRANRGMEGLDMTPAGKLMGVMQSALQNPSSATNNSANTRLVWFDPATGATKQFIYVQDKGGNSNSEIRAISETEFLLLERDGNFRGDTAAPAVYKRFYKISIDGATDVSDAGDSDAGKMVGEKTIEQASVAELSAAGIVPVRKMLVVDLLTVEGLEYNHDKLEGMSILDSGKTLVVCNDDDFGVLPADEGGITAKLLPATGEVDRNVLYFFPIDLEKPWPATGIPQSVEVTGGLFEAKASMLKDRLTLRVQAPSAGELQALLYDGQGRLVRHVLRTQIGAGVFETAVALDAAASSNAYFLALKLGAHKRVIPLVAHQN